MHDKDLARFECKISKGADDACWIWIAARNRSGYGRMIVQGNVILAHRLAYDHWVGPIPEGLHVLHRCDVRECVNPSHLFVGTNADNVADRVSKGRSGGAPRYGEAVGTAKLTEAQVREMRRLRAIGASRKRLAEMFGVHEVTVSCIVHRKLWKHVA